MKTLFSIFAVVVAAAMVSCGNANQPAEAVDSTEVVVACDSICTDSAQVVVEEAVVETVKK